MREDPKTQRRRRLSSDPMKFGSALLFAAAALTAQQVSSTQQFTTVAALGELTQLKLGQAAYQNASNPQLKAFAKQMVDVHSEAIDRLMGVASLENLTVPTDLDRPHQAEIEQLSKLSGAAFDKAYIAAVIKDHQQDLALYQRETASGDESGVKKWATAEIPTIQEHLQSAQTLASSLGMN
jgi:putative membrane protein